jgi:TorA maturation chaperone TorD
MVTGNQATEVERTHTYRLLSQAYQAPDQQLPAGLAKARGIVAGSCARIAEYELQERDLERLRVDHSRLFVGPFRLLAPPYGSVYLEPFGRLMGDSTVDVRRRYEEEGLTVELSEVPDHVAIELEFAHFLCVRAAKAIGDSDQGLARAYLWKRRAFLSVHLGAWIDEFTAGVRRHAQTAFYRDLAEATEAFVLDDLAHLGGERNDSREDAGATPRVGVLDGTATPV